MPRRHVDPTDKYVGNQVRYFRSLLNMSQTELGKSLGITFQQIQKYEKGDNRISSGRLHIIAGVLGQPLTAFFPKGDAVDTEVMTLKHSQQTLRLVHAFNMITSPSLRTVVLSLCEEIVDEQILLEKEKKVMNGTLVRRVPRPRPRKEIACAAP